ncbi:acyltransferase family protein [Actinoplanes sp. HUAS TT8]|uniref:acyltransferase family protein n=1 Tax=Actinoplanes sp. HUAS TT8 TaxID=3447453 RepID=UPI003F51E39D
MTRSRLAWLDALRGFAAAVVALFHLSPTLIGSERHLAIYRHFDLGRYGVLLFFLVSGYVIPMSLERHGSLRRFWVGRIFRIYPAYLLATAAGLLLVATGWQRWENGDPVAVVLGHVTMLQDLLGLSGVVRPFWTLTYEMTFYLIVAGLFVWRRHHDSAWWAGGLALVALVGGRHLPDALLGGSRLLAVGLAVLVGGGFMAYVIGRRILIFGCGLAGIGTVLLPMLNGQAGRYAMPGSSSCAVLLLAAMFAGTVVFRVQHHQIRPGVAVPVLLLVLTATGVNQWLLDGTRLLRDVSVAVAVAGTFAVAFLMRRRAVPGLMTRLGEISFSVYLLHIPVLMVTARLLRGHPAAIGVSFVAGTLAVAWMSFHLVERPGQRLGARVLARLDARFGPDTPVIIPTTEGGTPRTGSFGSVVRASRLDA